LNANASVAGAFNYAPPAGTVLNAGNGQTLTANFTPTDMANYSPTSAVASVDVLKAPLTVAADPKSKVYGDSDPTLTWQRTAGTLFGSDSLTGSISRVAGENVGAYQIGQGTLTAGSNYAITFVPTNLTITPRLLTVTADNVTKLLGAPLPIFTATYNGFVNGETTNNLGALANLNTSATISSLPGTYPIVPSGGVAANYAFSNINGVLTVPVFQLKSASVNTAGDITLLVNIATNATLTMEVSSDLRTWQSVPYTNHFDGTLTIGNLGSTNWTYFYRGILTLP